MGFDVCDAGAWLFPVHSLVDLSMRCVAHTDESFPLMFV